MYLLKKSAIASELAQQKKQEIDQGLELARKVDALRIKLLDLERQEKEFIDGMRSRLKQSTGTLEAELAELNHQVEQAKLALAELKQPLDAEWSKVKVELVNIEDSKLKVARGLARLDEKEAKLVLLEKEGKSKLSNIKIRERELENAYKRAIQNEEDSRIALERSQNVQGQAEFQFRAKAQEFAEVEAVLRIREREVEMKSNKLDQDKEELIIKEAQLKDREETLEREIKRQTNG